MATTDAPDSAPSTSTPAARRPTSRRELQGAFDLRDVGASIGLTRAERVDVGKSIRERVSRPSHAEWSPPSRRPDPVDVLIRTAKGRQEDLLPIRYARMAASPFAFFRGAAAIMALDLAPTPVTGLTVQTCGDAHLSNFGTFASPERNLCFDLNDFDETLPGPWEWDLKRLVASLVVAARDIGLKPKEADKAVSAASASYRRRVAEFAEMRHLDLFYYRIDSDEVLALASDSTRFHFERALAKARRRTNEGSAPKLVEFVDGGHRLKVEPPLTTPVEDPRIDAGIRRLLEEYRPTLHADRRLLLSRYSVVDVAHKVVGVGSVGRRCYVAFLMGSDTDDPLFLQIKESQQSVLEPYLGRSDLGNHAHRIVTGQRIMQAATDPFLGWGRMGRYDVYVRQMRDMKGSVEVEAMDGQALAEYASLCGWVLARGHARSGSPARIAGYLGRSESFDRAMVRFANRYADQNEADHAALLAAIDAGRVPAAAPEF